MSARSFTLQEANALLPALESTFARLAVELETLRSSRDRIAVLDALWGPAVERPGNPDHDELRQHRAAVDSCARRMDRLIEREVLARGIRFPGGGLEHGLLDFPARLHGRWVFLCWRRGEPEVAFWHDVDAGFAGRQRIGQAERAALSGDRERHDAPSSDDGSERDEGPERDEGFGPHDGPTPDG